MFLYDDLLLFIDQIRMLIIYPSLSLNEPLTGQFALQGEFRSSEWWRLFYEEEYEVLNAYPARGFRVIFLPSLNQINLVILGYDAGVELLCIL